MKLKAKILLFNLLISVSSFSLSLDKAIELSLKYNNDILKAKNNVYIKQQP